MHAFQKILKRVKVFPRWGPVIAGLALIPALPFICDEPVEHVIDWAFDEWWPDQYAHLKKEH